MPPTSPQINPAILAFLNLSAKTCTLTPLSGGMSSASAFRLSTTSPLPNAPSTYFVKTGKENKASVMFRGEHASLNAIHGVVADLCPRSLGWGKLESESEGGGDSGDGGAFLVTEFLDLGGDDRRASKNGDGKSTTSLASKLAKLHTTPVPPVPSDDQSGYGGKSMYGFPVPTCCGDTPQRNTWKESWADFFAEERLRFILERCEEVHGLHHDTALREVVSQTIETVVPRLLRSGHLGGETGIQPVVVHGDLWSGNKGVGRIGDAEDAVEQEVVFDPSACYAHSEYELGIMGMFGGFGTAFWEEYHGFCPKTEPVEEYEDRVDLYKS